MKTNMLGKIALAIKHIGKTRLDFTHDVSTTAGFGDLQPSTCKLILPNSNGNVESKSLVRFAPMVAPTFGRIKAKEYHHLVPLSDLFENFAYMLAQGKRATGNAGRIISPTRAPHMTLGLLSRFILVGAQVEIYEHTVEDNERQTVVHQSLTPSVADTYRSNFNTDQGIANWFRAGVDGSGVFSDYHGSMFNLGRLTSYWASAVGLVGWQTQKNFWVPIRNKSAGELFGEYQKIKYVNGVPQTEYSINHLPLDKSSICITAELEGGHVYTFAFRLSSFGKRLRKQIIGSGKQINMCSTAPVELVSLCAIWKAYFDLFGLTLYENYEVSPLAEFCKFIDLNNLANMDQYWVNDETWRFFMALGKMWFTDAQDIVSAHVPTTAISPSLGLGESFIDVSGTGAHITEVDNRDGQNTNGHAFINAVEHGALDAEYLMRLYRWCNKNTIAGKAIEKVLRAQNLGDFVDSCKSNFIGYHEEMMQIFDVVSTADTFKDGEGSLLGEYGGRGIKVYNSGRKSFDTNEYAFQVSLFTIVPEAGYLQSIDPASYAIKKTDMLLADFDAVGFEATRKSIVCGAENWSSQADGGEFGSMDENFGFIPRGTHLKLAHSIANGDITLRDTRDAYLPYTVDKFIDVGERRVVDEGGTDSYHRLRITRMLTPDDVPHASLHYRFPCRYPWLGNFARIFAYQGEPLDLDFYEFMMENPETASATWEYLENSYDNFIVHSIVSEPVWSPCKAIEESFETFEDGEKPNAKMEKA